MRLGYSYPRNLGSGPSRRNAYPLYTRWKAAGSRPGTKKGTTMSKKMLLALAAVSAALFALPTAASAQSWHLNSVTNFSVTGNGGLLTWTNGNILACSATTGAGSFSTTTEGTVSMVFHDCTAPPGFSCTSPGQPTGRVVFSAKVDGIMLGTNKPGVLVTPVQSAEPTSGMKTLLEMSCIGFLQKIFGKGLIGTISAPACGAASSTATVTFESSSGGHQIDKTYTGNTFNLATTLSESHPSFSLDMSWLLTFAAPRTITCTN
jgi:hypothetical protein